MSGWGRGRWGPSGGYMAAFLVFGMGVAALGPALPLLALHTGSSLGRISLVFAASAAGYLGGSLLAGTLFDRLPGHPILGVVLLLMAAMAALIPLATELWLLTLLFLLFGLAQGLVEVGVNTLQLWLHPGHAGPAMNALHFFFGAGALAAPLGVALATRATGDLTWFFWLFALLIVPVAVWLLGRPSPPRPASRPSRDGAAGRSMWAALRGSPAVPLAALFLFLYIGVENGVGGWIPSFAQALYGLGTAQAALLASAFWAALTAGRLLAIPIGRGTRGSAPVPPQVLVAAGLAGALAAVAVLALWPGRVGALWLGTLGLGLSLASIAPSMLALLERRVGANSQVTAWVFFGLGLGKLTLPWGLGQAFQLAGPRSLLWALGLLLAAAAGVFVRGRFEVRGEDVRGSR